MKIFKLIAKNAMRHKLRSFLTALGIAVAILAFGLLRTVIDAYFIGVEASSDTRLVTRNAVSLTFPLPLAYREKIAKIPGVTNVAHGNWFGGTYKDPKNFFAQFAVDPEPFLELYPELILTEKERNDFLQQRNSCIVGEKLAERFGWEVGDSFRLIGTIFPGNWDFVIRGIYDGRDRATDETTMYFHWDYINERLEQAGSGRVGQVGIYWIGVASMNDVVRVSEQVDTRFDNSLAETKTETEKDFQLGFVSMTGTIITAVQTISVVVVAIILLVLANTMAMTARERFTEYAILKTLGFRSGHIVGLILGESTFIALLGGVSGLLISIPLIQAFGAFMTQSMGNIFPVFEMTQTTMILAMIATILVGLLAAFFPTWQALSLKISDGLRRID